MHSHLDQLQGKVWSVSHWRYGNSISLHILCNYLQFEVKSHQKTLIILYPYASWCEPKPITNISAPSISRTTQLWEHPDCSSCHFHLLGQTSWPIRERRKEECGRMHMKTWLSFVTVTLPFSPNHQHHAMTWNAVSEEIWKGPTKIHCFLRLCGLNSVDLLGLNCLDIFENHSSKWTNKILVLWKLLFSVRWTF